MREVLRCNIGAFFAGLIGVAVFFVLFGFSAVDLTGYRLFSRGDPGMHYLGWRFFREAPWQGKIGMMNSLDFPYSVSVIFTDSIPIIAVIFKLFRGILPGGFNYFGLWTLFCFFMQGYMAYKLMTLRVKNREIIYTAVMFFVITPAFIKRAFWHTALTSHFLILAALFLLLNGAGRGGQSVDTAEKDAGKGVKADARKDLKRELLCWALLGFLCGGIHLYFLGICGMICVITAIYRQQETEEAMALLFPVSFGISGAFMVWLLGAFDSGMLSGAPGFGYYSFNLNGFFNGDSWSRFFNFPYHEGGQIEGFAYLGAGMLFLILIATVFIITSMVFNHAGFHAKSGNILKNSGFGACAVLIVISVLFAASGKLTYGKQLLFEFDFSGAGVINKIFDIFRSSGRFAWIAMYLLMLYGFYGISAVYEHSFKDSGRKWQGIFIGILLLSLFIQLYDIAPGLSKRSSDVRGTENYESPLYNDYWNELAAKKKYKHIVFMDKEDLSQEELYGIAFFAAENGMTVNDFNFARALNLNIREIARDSAAHPGDDYIYIFTRESQALAADFKELDYRIADLMLVGVKKE